MAGADRRHPRFGAALLAALFLAGPAGAQTSDLVSRSTLRVCGDPANMPFTNERGEGFENKIAELLAADLKLPLDYTWFPQATGFYRMTLGAKRCDVVLGFGAGADPVLNTNPYYKSAWVFVSREGGPLAELDSLSDPRLKERRLGIVAGTPPASILAIKGLLANIKPYQLMVDRRFESPAEQMIADIASGEIDGGVLWGPIGGYYARKAAVPMTVTPLLKETEGPPMVFRITFGIRPGEDNWKHQLNSFIAARRAEIDRILLDYGVPILDEQNRPIAPPKG